MAVAAASNRLVVFILDGQRYGLTLFSVARVLRAVEITPLPQAPDIVLGVIDIQGRLTPVVNLRRRFGLPERAIAASDEIVVAHTGRRSVALVADTVVGVIEYSTLQAVSAGEILPGLIQVDGVVKLEDGMVLIHDLDRFLSLDEDAALERAVEAT